MGCICDVPTQIVTQHAFLNDTNSSTNRKEKPKNNTCLRNRYEHDMWLNPLESHVAKSFRADTTSDFEYFAPKASTKFFHQPFPLERIRLAPSAYRRRLSRWSAVKPASFSVSSLTKNENLVKVESWRGKTRAEKQNLPQKSGHYSDYGASSVLLVISRFWEKVNI